jgi:hypothetical protein
MQILTGTARDTTCGNKCKMMPGKSDAECVWLCRQGLKVRLVAG